MSDQIQCILSRLIPVADRITIEDYQLEPVAKAELYAAGVSMPKLAQHRGVAAVGGGRRTGSSA